MSKIKVAIVGFGQRGIVYANAIKKHHDEVELTAVCEPNTLKYDMIINDYNVSSENIYKTFEDFISIGKIADILVISTMDQLHYEQALKAIDLKYDILLEKPIALSKKEIYEIKEKAKSNNVKVSVAHVLRYTPFYQKIKEIITSKELGNIVNITQTENVGYLHYAHSFVRGNWHREADSAPMILAKSCHDLDIITYLMNERVESISSNGALSYFIKENAPLNSSNNCIDCKSDCPFNAIKFYENNRDWMAFFTTEKNIEKVFANRDLNYGKCVFKMDNDVVDHQSVMMSYENGSQALFLMTAFSKETHRNIKVHLTLGEIEGDLDKGLIIVKPYGKEDITINVNDLWDDFSYHSGGDYLLFIDFVRSVKNDNMNFKTNIINSVESHYLAFEAEKSRLNKGKQIDMKKDWKDYL